ncbi:unnamed protein product, partial [Polarella glacialis]
ALRRAPPGSSAISKEASGQNREVEEWQELCARRRDLDSELYEASAFEEAAARDARSKAEAASRSREALTAAQAELSSLHDELAAAASEVGVQ